MSNVTTYWDLSEAERAALTRDDVARFIDVELMEKGVLKPKPLVLVDLPVVELEKETYFQIEREYEGNFNGVAFRTAEDAFDAIKRGIVAIAQDWQAGGTTKYPLPITPDVKVVTIQLATKASVEASRATLKEVAAAKSENDRRTREHDEQARKVEATLKDLWDDWYRCTAKDTHLRRVADTFAEYKRTAGGSVAIAARFLRKAFPLSIINEAEAWTQTKMTGLGEDVAVADAEHAADF